MISATSLSGWALFGAAVRGYQLGIKQRAFTYKPLGYVYSALLWSGIGYAFYGLVERQEVLLQKRVAGLVEARSKRQSELAGAASTNE